MKYTVSFTKEDRISFCISAKDEESATEKAFEKLNKLVEKNKLIDADSYEEGEWEEDECEEDQ